MPLQENKFLVSDDAKNQANNAVQAVNNNPSKLVGIIRKLLTDVEKIATDLDGLSNQKADTTNLKNSYKQFVEDYNSNAGIINARLNAIEDLLKQTVAKLNEFETI